MLNALCVDADDLATAHQETGRTVRNPQYHLEAETEAVLAELDRLGLKATFFVPGMFVRLARALVRRLADGGHQVAAHGSRHTHLHKLSPESFAQDVRQNKRTLEDLAGVPVEIYKAPFWSIVPWAYDVLLEEGFRADHSAMPAARAQLGQPRGTLEPFVYRDALLVIPVTSVELLGASLPFNGGFYNAWVPFAFQRRVFDAVNGRGLPFNFYFHPFEHSPGPRNRTLVKYGSLFISLYAAHAGRYRALLRRMARRYQLGTLASAYARWLERL